LNKIFGDLKTIYEVDKNFKKLFKKIEKIKFNKRILNKKRIKIINLRS